MRNIFTQLPLYVKVVANSNQQFVSRFFTYCKPLFLVLFFLFNAYFSSLQAQTHRASASSGSTSGDLSLTIAKPTGTLSGDVMIAAITFKPSTATITVPSGWTLIRRTNRSTGNSFSQATYSKVAEATEPDTYNWTFNISTGSAAGISSFYNVNLVSPINVHNGVTTASSLTHVTPNVSTTAANTLVLALHSLTSCATWTTPAGMAQLFDISSDPVPNTVGVSLQFSFVLQPTAGATGAKSSTASNGADFGITQILALAKAPNGQWTGKISTDWAIADNWTNGVLPTATTDVVIPANVTQPTISTSVFCKSLTINAGATLTTTATGTLNIRGNITNYGTMANNGTTNFNGTTQQTVTGVTTFNNLTLTKTRDLLLGGDISVNGNVTITTGTLNANNNDLIVNGNWTNNTGFTPGTGIVTFAGTGAQRIGGTLTTTFNNLTISSGDTVSLTALCNVSGNLSVFAGAFELGAFTANRTAAGGTLTVSTGAAMVIGGTNSIPINYTVHSIGAGSTINYSGTTQSVALLNSTQNYGNLIISGSGTKTLAANETVAGNLSIDAGTLNLGTYTINRATTGGTLAIGSGATLIIGGANTFPLNYSTHFIGTLTTVDYSGTNQVIAGLNSGQNYVNLKVSGTGTKTLSSDETVTGILTFSGPTITTGSFILYLASTATVARTTGHVVGKFKKNIALGATTKIFEVGDATNYTPLTVAFASVTTSGDLTAAIVASEHPALDASGIRTDRSVNKYFTFSNNAIEFTSASITMNWLVADIDAGSTTANFGVAAFNNISWGSATTASPFETSIQATGVTSFGEFAIGERCAMATISYTGTPYCSSTGTATVSRFGTSGGTYSSTAGLIIDPATGTVTPGTSTAGTYIVTYTIPSSSGCKTFTTTTSITITAQPYSTGAYPFSPYCNSGFAIPTGSASAAGVMSSGVGLALNLSNGVVDLGASTPGPYIVSYIIPASGGCPVFVHHTNITIVAAPAASVSYTGSPFCSAASIGAASITGTSGGTFSSTTGLTINATTGAVQPVTSTPGTYTVTYSIPAVGTCAAFATTTSVTINSTIFWTGAVNSDWELKDNWRCGLAPNVNSDVIIPSGLLRYPVIPLTKTYAVRNLTIEANATLTVFEKLQVGGNITNAGKLIADAGTVEFNGTIAQVLPAGLLNNNKLASLEVNNPSGLTLGGTVNLSNILTITKGALNTGGYLTLKSDINNTARVGVIMSSAPNPIVGDVTVERYVPGRRKYRLITSSVTTSNLTALPAGQESKSIWGNWQNGGVTTANVGAFITGGTTADGFDQQTSNASLFTYNDTIKKYVAVSSANGKNTKYTPLKAGVGYYIFVYGDRRNSITALNPNPTVLKATGTLLTGNQLYSTTSAVPISATVGRFSLIGNPYACTIDWKSIMKSGVSKTIWGWDANLSSTGGYVTVTATLLGALIAPLSDLIAVNRYVQPGQGFFVQTTGANPEIMITENDKINDRVSINSNVFRGAGVNEEPLIATNLIYDNGFKKSLVDGALIAFDSSFTNEVSDEDGIKMAGTTEGLSTVVGTAILSINARRMPTVKDTIFLNLERLTKPQYTLQVFARKMAGYSVAAYLEDTYLNTLRQLSYTDTSDIIFTVNSDPASFRANRFRIVFRQLNTLPVIFTSIKATRKNKDLLVEWDVANESGIKSYNLEHSIDGTTFNSIANVPSIGNNIMATYKWLDINPIAASHYYRVRGVQPDGNYYVSKVVVVKTESGKSSVVVFPNPIKNSEINLRIEEIEKGLYTLLIHNGKGQLVLKTEINHNGGSGSYLIKFDSRTVSGYYYLQLKDNKLSFSQKIYKE
ncbi:MAG: C-terminal target protein [Segetibacter sp.]|nr:C-terminal target protein [Segetibacter sp.]